MGGKTWSREEEEVFWLQMVPLSPKRLGDDIEKNEERHWEWIAQEMKRIMGPNARRNYTGLSTCEYLYFNFVLPAADELRHGMWVCAGH